MPGEFCNRWSPRDRNRAPRSSSRRQSPSRLSRVKEKPDDRTMSSIALSPAAVSRPAVNHWVVAIVVVVPTFMEILDTTIANVALRYIAGGLSAAQTDADWVITSYLAANAIVLPITGWLSARLGRRNYFLLSHRRLHARLGAVRLRHQPGADDPVPRHPGAGRRRAPAVQPGRPAGRLPAGEAGHGHDAVRRRRHYRARSSARRSAAGSASTTTGGGSSSSTSRSACLSLIAAYCRGR